MTNETPTEVVPTRGFILGDAVYGKLKSLALVVIPAVSTLYFTLGSVWDFPSVEQMIGTLAALDTFLGVLLGLSTRSYNASEARYVGTMMVQAKEDGGKLFTLELNGDPADLEQRKEVIFKVDALPQL